MGDFKEHGTRHSVTVNAAAFISPTLTLQVMEAMAAKDSHGNLKIGALIAEENMKNGAH